MIIPEILYRFAETSFNFAQGMFVALLALNLFVPLIWYIEVRCGKRKKDSHISLTTSIEIFFWLIAFVCSFAINDSIRNPRYVLLFGICGFLISHGWVWLIFVMFRKFRVGEHRKHK